MRILVNALSGIGDALMFTPALVKLRELLPESRIDVLVMYKGVEDFYSRLEQVNNVYYFDFFMQGKKRSLKFVSSFRGKYDATINVYPSNRKEYNIISLLQGAPKRVGVRYLRRDQINMGYLNNVWVKENDNLHNVEENIKLVEKLTGKKIDSIPDLVFPVTPEDELYAEKFLTESGIMLTDFVVGFHAGCSTLKNHINRRWSPENFASLAKRLSEEQGARVLIFGGPDENELKNSIVKMAGSAGVIPVNAGSLRESAAVMKRCNLFVTNDSGLMHVAAALKLKTVALIGPTSVNYIKPWHTEHIISSLDLTCAPCFRYSPKPLNCTRKDVQFKCIRELSVDKVYNDAMKLAEPVKIEIPK